VKSAVIKVFLFMMASIAVFIAIGGAVTRLTGGGEEIKSAGAVEISPEGGEAIYWGKGRCSTCHSMGDRGSAVRCPNHGQFGDKFPLPMGARAVERAKEREKATGLPYTATDYLAESVGMPGAYLVEGYKNEMPVTYAPPISLTLDEVKAVIMYLQSQGGEVDVEAIKNPTGLTKKIFDQIGAASAAGGGDPANGEKVFFEGAGCAGCHTLKGKGEALGPDLSSAGLKPLKYLSDAILKPAAYFTSGFETYTAVGKDGKDMIDENGRRISGVKISEDSGSVSLGAAAGVIIKVDKALIKELARDVNKSVMPEDLAEGLTVKDFQDLLAFLLLQKGEEK